MNDATTLRRELIQQVEHLPADRLEEVLRFVGTLQEQSPSPISEKPISKHIEALTRKVPQDAWRRMPADGAEQHDHYIYGTPKRKP